MIPKINFWKATGAVPHRRRVEKLNHGWEGRQMSIRNNGKPALKQARHSLVRQWAPFSTSADQFPSKSGGHGHELLQLTTAQRKDSIPWFQLKTPREF